MQIVGRSGLQSVTGSSDDGGSTASDNVEVVTAPSKYRVTITSIDRVITRSAKNLVGGIVSPQSQSIGASGHKVVDTRGIVEAPVESGREVVGNRSLDPAIGSRIDNAVGRTINNIEIGPGASHEGIGTTPSVEGVVPRTTQQGIGTDSPQQGTSLSAITPKRAAEGSRVDKGIDIIADTVEVVGDGGLNHTVDSCIDNDIAGTSDDVGVGSSTTHQRICASAADQGIVTSATQQGVVTRGTGKFIS